MDYKKEEMKLLNMKRRSSIFGSIDNRNHKFFEIERTESIHDKTLFIDAQHDGIASYLIELFNKWDNEKDGLPKNAHSKPKTVSKKAWIRKNDTREIIDITYELGSYRLFGTKFKDMTQECPTTEHGFDLAYSGKNVVEQWFHDSLILMYREEKKYFEDNDPFTIKLNKVKDLGNRHHIIFNSQELNDIVWNRKTDVSEENLDVYISVYEDLEKSIDTIETALHNALVLEKIE